MWGGWHHQVGQVTAEPFGSHSSSEGSCAQSGEVLPGVSLGNPSGVSWSRRAVQQSPRVRSDPGTWRRRPRSRSGSLSVPSCKFEPYQEATGLSYHKPQLADQRPLLTCSEFILVVNKIVRVQAPYYHVLGKNLSLWSMAENNIRLSEVTRHFIPENVFRYLDFRTLNGSWTIIFMGTCAVWVIVHAISWMFSEGKK